MIQVLGCASSEYVHTLSTLRISKGWLRKDPNLELRTGCTLHTRCSNEDPAKSGLESKKRPPKHEIGRVIHTHIYVCVCGGFIGEQMLTFRPLEEKTITLWPYVGDDKVETSDVQRVCSPRKPPTPYRCNKKLAQMIGQIRPISLLRLSLLRLLDSKLQGNPLWT